MSASGMQQELDSSGKNRECVEASLTKESIGMDKSADVIDCVVEGSEDVSREEQLLSPTSLEGSLERHYMKEQKLPPTVPDLQAGGGQDEKLHGSECCLEVPSAHKGTFREAGLGIFEVVERVFDSNRGKSKEKGQVLGTAFPGQLLESWKKDPCPRLPLVSEAEDGQEDPFRVHSLSQQTRWKVERTCSNDCVSEQGDDDLALTGVGKGTQRGRKASQAKTDEAKCEEDTALNFESVPKLCTNKSVKTNVLIKPCFVLLKDIGREIKAKRECGLIEPHVTKLPQETQSRKKTVIKEPKVVLCDIMKRGNVESLKKPLQMQKDAKENQKKKRWEPNSSANIPGSEEAGSGETNLVYDGKKPESKVCSPDISSFCDVGIFTKLSNYINSMDPGHVDENGKGKEGLQVDSAPFPDTQKTSFTEAKAPKVTAPQMGASFVLPDEADLSESACESQSCILSLRSEENLNFDTRDTVPSKIQIQMPIELCPLTEEGIQKEVDVTEVERLMQSDSEADDCWFLVEIDEIIEVKDPVCVTDEDNLARERDCGDDVPLSPGNGLPQSEIDSGCELQADDAEDVKKLTRNRTVANQGTRPRRSANRRAEGKIYPVSTVWPKPSSSGGSRAKEKKTQEEPPANHPWLSQSQNRAYVVDALRKTLQKRLDDSPDLNVQENTAQKLAERIERALFKLFCGVDQHYKTKYRSLRFNLKSTDKVLFRKVVLGDITPKRLVQMTSLDMAPKELAEWRVSENKRALEVIEREEQEAQRSCPTKFTHKGIVEIHREADEDWALQGIHESQPLDSRCEAPTASERKPSFKNLHHTSDSACSTSTKQKSVISQKGFVSSHIEKKEEKISKRDHPNSPCLYGEEKSLPEDSVPKKHPRTEKQSRNTIVWNGLIEMFSLKQFAAKAYPVSGSISHLAEALPLLLQSRGCIHPEDVWVYLDSMWPANSKEMGIIRFCPSLAKSHNPYNMLYSYLNNKQRYGIVKTSQMEMFMVSLAAFQPLPSKLHKIGGPGLDPCHPSLLLGLILPKRTTSILVTRPSPLPKAKRKKVTFKDSTEVKFSDPPSPVDTSLAQPPRQLPMPGLPCENEGPQDPIGVDALCSLSEDAAGAMSSSTHCKDTADSTNPSSLGSLLQSLSSYPWMEGQTLGTLEPQPYQTMCPGQFGMDSDPSYPWNSLGFLLPSESVYPNQHEAFNTMFFPNQLCAEAAPSHEVSPASWLHQIPCTTSEPPNSIMEETFALIQRVSEMQPHLQGQLMTSTAVGFPAPPQEGGSTLPQDVTGSELPPDQHDNDMLAQLQLLLSTLSGQAQPPSAI